MPGFVEVKAETPRKCLADFAAALDYYCRFSSKAELCPLKAGLTPKSRTGYVRGARPSSLRDAWNLQVLRSRDGAGRRAKGARALINESGILL